MNKNISFLFIIYILLFPILLGLISPPFIHAQTVDNNLWVTNGDVNAIVRSANTIYIGGHFTYVGPPTGYGAAIDINTGNPNLFSQRSTVLLMQLFQTVSGVGISAVILQWSVALQKIILHT